MKKTILILMMIFGLVTTTAAFEKLDDKTVSGYDFTVQFENSENAADVFVDIFTKEYEERHYETMFDSLDAYLDYQVVALFCRVLYSVDPSPVLDKPGVLEGRGIEIDLNKKLLVIKQR